MTRWYQRATPTFTFDSFRNSRYRAFIPNGGATVVSGEVAKVGLSYLSKRLRRQGQTEGALTNTKVSLVSILKNDTFLTNQLSTDLKFTLLSKGL